MGLLFPPTPSRPGDCPLSGGHISRCGGSCECDVLSPVAGAYRWLLLLLSLLLSAQPGESLGLWAKRTANTSSSADVLRRMRMQPAVHGQAAATYQHAAEFFDERGQPGKADRERGLADREAQEAGAVMRPPRSWKTNSLALL
jgi:hypothetical protein